MTTVSSSSIAAILVAFAAYLLFMIVIGAICMRRTNSSEDYFLGGRGLNAWVAALSAQASDMSGWLLMGLPGSIYALGTGQAWIAIGLFLGTVCNWLLISKRLRRYTIVAGNSMTLPEFLENRFHDKKKVLLSISSVVIIIFFLDLVYNKLKKLARNHERAFLNFGSASDPYMEIEKELELTREILKIFLRFKYPVHIITKSDLILRDTDILKKLNDAAILPDDLKGLKSKVPDAFGEFLHGRNRVFKSDRGVLHIGSVNGSQGFGIFRCGGPDLNFIIGSGLHFGNPSFCDHS